MTTTADSASRRGTRPANRRATIVHAASELIHTRGYEHVSMSNIADAVEVRPSALYRHFTNKQHLLAEVIRNGLTPVKAAIDELNLTDQDSALHVLAELTLDHPGLGLMWLREVQHLPPDQQKAVTDHIQHVAAQLADKCRHARPDLDVAAADLLAWSILGVLLSASFHGLAVSRSEYSTLLVSLLTRVLSTPILRGFSIGGTRTDHEPGLEPLSRREALLMHATRLFAQRRYAGVGIEDVGAALGMSGPSIYNHFSGKSELLGLALSRGAAYLHLQVAEVLPMATTPAEGLSGLVASYTGFAFAHPDLVAILITEIRNLPDPYRAEAINAQHDYINEWTHLVQQHHPHDSALQARLTVHAALTIINSITQVERLRTAANSAETISGVVGHVLGITADLSQPWPPLERKRPRN